MIRRFNRFELKYVVPASTRDAFIDELRVEAGTTYLSSKRLNRLIMA